MGLFEKIFGPSKKQEQEQEKLLQSIGGYFQTLTAYAPTFVTFSGGVYEMDRTRAAIHAIATHSSKLKPHVTGTGAAALERQMQFMPNPWQTTSQFLYRTRTILECDNTAFLVPIIDRFGATRGVFPIVPSMAQVIDVEGEPYLRFMFSSGKWAAVEFYRCGVLTKFQYRDDLFGASNEALTPTMDLISTQAQGIANGIKQAAAIRFIGHLGNSLRDEDLKKEQERFRETNLSPENNGGLLLIDQKYKEVKQIESKPFVVDADQMKIIDENVNKYFGVNDKVIKNEWDESVWNAFYEGNVEPFALQLSLVLTNMYFSERARAYNNAIMFSANRLQFATIQNKVETITQLFDRGMLSINEGREIMQMEPVDGGDVRFVRGEYINTEDPAKALPGEKGGNEDAGET